MPEKGNTMADFTTYIGGTIGFVVAAYDPAAVAADYTAQAFAEIGSIKTIGELADSTADVAVPQLKTGRIIHLNGEKDLGEITVGVVYDSADTTYTDLRTLAEGNSNVWFDITDPDGEHTHFQGLIANWTVSERNGTTEKGATFSIRGNTQILYV